MPLGRGRSLRLNTAATFLPRIVTVAVALGLSPYIVSQVGLTAFGYWSVVLAVLQYAQIADGGFPIVAIRMIARGRAADDLGEIRSATCMVLGVLAVVGTAIVAGAFVLVAAMPASVGDDLPEGWQTATQLAGISLALTMLGTGFAAVPRGYDRWDLDAFSLVLGQVLGAAATVSLLASGGGLPALGVAAVVNSGAAALSYAVAAGRLGGLGREGLSVRRDLFGELRRQGGNLQVVALVGATNAQADRFLLLPFANLAWIGAYALGARVAVSVRAFPLGMFGPLIARLSATQREGMDAIRRVYLTVFKLVGTIGVPGLLVVYFAMYPATLAWLGSQYTISATAAVALGVGYGLNIATGPGTATAIACGKAELDRNYSLLGLGLNLALTPILGIAFGPWGVVAATTCGLVASSAWLVLSIDRWLGTTAVRDVLLDVRSLTSLAGVCVVGTLTIAVTVGLAPSTRLENVAVAGLSVAAGAALVVLPRVGEIRDALRSRATDV